MNNRKGFVFTSLTSSRNVIAAGARVFMFCGEMQRCYQNIPPPFMIGKKATGKKKKCFVLCSFFSLFFFAFFPPFIYFSFPLLLLSFVYFILSRSLAEIVDPVFP